MTPKKKKILFIGPLPPPYSGPELSTQQLLNSPLVDMFNVSFINTNVRKDNVKKGKADMTALLAVIKFNIALIKKLIAHRPHVAYHLVTPTQIGWLGRDIWFLFFCWLFRTKSVIHFRGSHLKLNYSNFNPVVKKIIKVLCKTVDRAVVQSKSLTNQFEGLVPEEKIMVIPNTIDDSFFELERDELSTPQFLFFGHLTKAKGYVDIVKVIPEIARKYPDVKFVFCGNMKRGEPGVKYNQYSGERITYEDPFEIEKDILNSPFAKNYLNYGVISGQEKLDALSQSWAFILPSYSEGFSRSILEAMASGLPVIATPVGANKDFIEHDKNGLVNLPGDLKQLEQNILNILESKERRDYLSKQAKATLKREFVEAIVIQKYITLFNTI
ncbi:glycosyltransferase family 4 protein [uncultured Psychroserpens sp.]|uniref:glycosyltransferase family 4 protein n=1 Tax=uncultured Psychroserpens sp. TaxID=255436 RepID=UPI002611F4D2|nr:glycosyltransferase family 4 protein [uncultured Psychroserpens sp.]